MRSLALMISCHGEFIEAVITDSLPILEASSSFGKAISIGE
jgi:hypothetical protein